MYTFNKSDLYYSDYAWRTTEGDSAKVTGFPDSVLLNRHEGYEVVYFINRFVNGQASWKDESNQRKKELGSKIEKMIHDYLPGDIRSHQKVHEWVVENWTKY
ncbi:hypothetical protein ACFQ21_02670 [Ohtaekwangia kribbensis]|uniref:Uncharacterized protein n=1 Tax=Ohtaekwangia kribbensis TaxID=688913 RepID=A0ABW3JYE3_9BACT